MYVVNMKVFIYYNFRKRTAMKAVQVSTVYDLSTTSELGLPQRIVNVQQHKVYSWFVR